MKRNGHGIIALFLSLLIALPSGIAPANIVVNGELQRAQLEKLSSAPAGSEARIYFNTTDKRGVLHDGTSFDNIVQETIIQTLTNKRLDSPKLNEAVDLTATSTELNQLDGVEVGGNASGDILTTDGAQTLTGKTFDDPITLQELSTTPATPSAGYKKIYPKDDGVLYTLNDAGEEVPVGTGSGSGGGKNYVQNPDAEINADNVTVTGSMTLASSDAQVIAGKKSFRVTDTGNGTIDFALKAFDAVDLGRLHRVDAWYAIPLLSKDITFGVYNVTDSAYVSAVKSLVTSADGTPDYVETSFVPQLGKTYVVRFDRTGGDTTFAWLIDQVSVSPDNVSGVAAGTGEYKEVAATTTTATATANTEIDATGLSLTLSPGRWEIGYSLAAQVSNSSPSTSARNGRVRITDSANTPVSNSETYIGDSQVPGTSSVTQNVSKQLVIDVAAETTYKIRITSDSDAGTGGSLSVLNESVNGVITNPDNASIFWAKNIGPEVNIANIKQTSPLKAGFIYAWPGDTPPPGSDFADGGELAILEYPELYAAIGHTWDTAAKQDGTGGNWTAPAAGYFRKPDLRGVTLRGVGTSSDSTGANDVSVTLGGFQDDSYKSHSHSFEGFDGGVSIGSGARLGLGTIVATGVSGYISANPAATSSLVNSTGGTRSDDFVQLNNSGSTETRGRSQGVHWLIKLYDDSIDLTGFASADTDKMGLIQLSDEFVATETKPGLVYKNKWQKKTLSANVTTNTTVSDLTFTGLTVGKTYRVSVNAAFNITTADGAVDLIAKDGSNVIFYNTANGANSSFNRSTSSVIYTSTSTTLTFETASVSASAYLMGGSGGSVTYAIVEELNNYAETTEW